MKLDTEFIRLPFRFDAARLAEEIAQIPESDWQPHPQGNPGNSALPLIALKGDPLDNGVKGPMRPTPQLAKLPYVRQIMEAFRVPLGRSRLMRLVGNAEATAHADVNYYWMRRTRIHIPVLTTPDVSFHCGERSLNMAAGECWLFDTWRIHNVLNPAPTTRIHLVIDTVGTPEFWAIAARSERPFGKAPANPAPVQTLAFEPGRDPVLVFESHNFPVVMSPEEQRDLLGQCLEEMAEVPANPPERIETVRGFLQQWMASWEQLWQKHRDRPEGLNDYRALVQQFDQWLPSTDGLKLPNGNAARDFLMHAVTNAALNPELATTASAETAEAASEIVTAPEPSRFDRPVFIVSAPRSGSSLLFETLARSPDFWTVGGESHLIFEKIPKFQPENHNWDSNRLTAKDLIKPALMRLRDSFVSHLRGREGRFLPADNSPFRMLEKTPKNALRVPMLAAAFPDARFIYLHRAPRDNLSSMLDAWRSAKFVTYPKLPDWTGDMWSLLLVPGWRDFIGRPLAEVVAHQWEATQRHLLEDLEQLPAERWCAVRYENFLKNPQQVVEQLCAFSGVHWDQELSEKLPLSSHTLTPPDPDKWKRNEAELEQMLPRVQSIAAKAEQVVDANDVSARTTPQQLSEVRIEPVAPGAAATPESKPDPQQQMFGSEFTSNLAQLLRQLKISLVVTTYQAGKMIVVRAQEDKLNTHFLQFQKPMGMTANQQRLAVGTDHAIQVYKNIPDVAKRKQPPAQHDACYVHQYTHNTGDIDIHEMAWGKDNQLWFLNTKFSTLCTLDLEHSFVPKWRPKFVTALSPDDRCHLNGLAMVDGKPRYVTALGETDSNEGWRQNKASGGIMIDITTDKIVCRGLSMPHSPRMHDGKIWVLESGKGSLGIVDFASGRAMTVAEVPGFTRGMDFYGNFAFIGLSQVRESIAFSGLPITERAQERNCGVWIVDLRNGQTVAFLKFKGAVQEIFSVQVLRNIQSPDILEQHDPLVASTYVLPTEALRQVPRQLIKA